MNEPDHQSAPAGMSPSRRSLVRRLGQGLMIGLAVYFVFAYLALPWIWKRYVLRHPDLANNPRLTHTADGHPGDPLNVCLIGSEAELTALLKAAQWFPANPLGLSSDLKIAVDTVIERPYEEAPVSNLFLFGRTQDLAFEKPVGNNPRQRNHVRFWKTPQSDVTGRAIWIGAASFDERVGLSHTTGQITHHIEGNVDRERDYLFADLLQTQRLSESYELPDFHQVLEGRNGGGDLWHTDGALQVGVIEAE